MAPAARDAVAKRPPAGVEAWRGYQLWCRPCYLTEVQNDKVRPNSPIVSFFRTGRSSYPFLHMLEGRLFPPGPLLALHPSWVGRASVGIFAPHQPVWWRLICGIFL
ncbi:hypothetical protein AVEN_125435-1 [Araneus ventricosus]|uniref:Uncharacterized protein n=1 Tax=Araneus ventricosus TaxID=182803 RepID=A0A4Y2M7G2_ARAVE|nr:hypothetical protein AVEN_125435-1 [Araneus ventricosus]